MKPKLLIVDADDEIRTQMKWVLATDYDVCLAAERRSALDAFDEHQPAVVLLDYGLPPFPSDPVESLTLLAEMLGRRSLTKVIIISGQNDRTHALEAIGAGAYDFLFKPIEVEVLAALLRRAFHVVSLEREYRQIQQQLQGESFEGMLGTSLAMQRVFRAIRRVATTDAPVLILGESGTGKECIAQAVHRQSARKEGPFVAINCGAIPEALLESELFGHEKGSFTGAHVHRPGRIEAAMGGTLFLDEIGELSLSLQVKLLRFLQQQTIQRLGGRQEIVVDARVVAATNRNLQTAMAEGKFREDLFYRLAVVVIEVPALRDRHSDLMLLAKTFLRRAAADAKRDGLSFDPEALRALHRHSWPGNVRELENRVRRAVIMAEGKRLTAADLGLSPSAALPKSGTLKEAREAIEREMIQHSLRAYNGKIAPAAAELGISRTTFYQLMQKLCLDRSATS